jgi:hypothetical protein
MRPPDFGGLRGIGFRKLEPIRARKRRREDAALLLRRRDAGRVHARQSAGLRMNGQRAPASAAIHFDWVGTENA